MPATPTTGPSSQAGGLVLGPLLRYVDGTSASVWVETAATATVTVTAGDARWSAPTFAVHGHHYALVECEGLQPGSVAPYAVEVDGVAAWPPSDGDLPAPVIATLPLDRPVRMAFGSCRTSVPHDAAGNRSHGVDALRSYGFAMAGRTEGAEAPDKGSDHAEGLSRPDLLLFLGDQVYADETSEEMREFITSRRDIDQPPGTELRDYEEYAHLYRLAWTEPTNRWLLSTLPSALIFDDHDVRDDWNTSLRWRADMAATDWWRGRIVAALASYWVYQHLGNLSPQRRGEDEVYRRVREHRGPEELDLTEVLDAFADRVNLHPDSYRWSYARELGSTRLVVVDSRAARRLEEGRRAMLDTKEATWLDGELQGDCDHLLIGTSLPFLLPQGLHHLEAFDEVMARGDWGDRVAGVGERLRQGADLEHWGAFQESFRQVCDAVLAVVRGERGSAPRTVTFLSGDVHHSYVSQVLDMPRGTQVIQAVCSPIRNPLPGVLRFATVAASYGIAGPVGALAGRLARVPEAPLRWRRVQGPWFQNMIATLEVRADGLAMWWFTGVVEDGRNDRPRLSRVASVLVDIEGVHPRPERRAARALGLLRPRAHRAESRG